MQLHNSLQKNGQVEVFSRDYGSSKSSVMTVEEALAQIKAKEITCPFSTCRLTAGWSQQKGCYFKLGYWAPYEHPVPCCWNVEVRFRPWRKFDHDNTIVWNRSGSPPPLWGTQSHKQEKNNEIAAGFDVLFFLLVQMDVQRLAIGELKHDLAGPIMSWHFKLASERGICRIPRVEFPGHSKARSSDARRQLNLCQSLIRDGPTEVAFERLDNNYSQEELHSLLEASQDAKNLRTLDLRTCLQIDDMYREIPVSHDGPYMHSSDKFEDAGVPISPLVDALIAPNCTITDVNLGGLRLTQPSAMVLASQLASCKSLERLGLRATGLSEDVLVLLFEKGLASNDSLKELDLSWNAFTPKVMRALCNGLKTNQTLEKLRVEHCGIDLDSVQILCSALGQFKGLRHLSLDGNEFTWTPLVNMESQGVLDLVKGMKYNLSLTSMKVGEYGMVDPVSRVCCTGPTYTEHMGLMTRYELQNCFERNRKLHREQKWLRSKSAVVRLAGLLLSKVAETNQDTSQGSSGLDVGGASSPPLDTKPVSSGVTSKC